VEKYSRGAQSTIDVMPHANGYKLEFRLCKIYIISIATMNARTRLNVTLQYIACLVMNVVTISNNFSVLWISLIIKLM